MACKHLHVVNFIDTTTTENTVILDFSVAATATDKDRFCIKFPCCMNIPSSAASYAVQVTVNGAAVPVFDKYANPLIASEITGRKFYKGYYGNQTSGHVILEAPVSYNVGCKSVIL